MMNDVNIPSLRKAVEWAEAEAAKPWEICEWYQGAYSSDPGSIDLMLDPESGDELFESKYARPYYSNETGKLLWVDYRKSPACGTCYCIAGYVAYNIVGKKSMSAGTTHQVAQEELGLDFEQADRLFAAGNSIEEVREIAEKIAGEKL